MGGPGLKKAARAISNGNLKLLKYGKCYGNPKLLKYGKCYQDRNLKVTKIRKMLQRRKSSATKIDLRKYC